MKRFFMIVLLASIILSSCNTDIYYWDFSYELENVVEIQIVDIVDIDGSGKLHHVVVQTLEDSLFEDVWNDITSLEMTKYGPNLKHPIDLSIIILFDNGDSDIISSVAPTQIRYNEDGERREIVSWFKCEPEQYNALIKKYMNW